VDYEVSTIFKTNGEAKNFCWSGICGDHWIDNVITKNILITGGSMTNGNSHWERRLNRDVNADILNGVMEKYKITVEDIAAVTKLPIDIINKIITADKSIDDDPIKTNNALERINHHVGEIIKTKIIK
jgi:hypothetical protein